MNICILTHCYPTDKNPIGGNFIPEFAHELMKQGYKVTILVPKMKDQIPVDFGIPVIAFDWLGGEKLLGKFKLYNPMDLIKLLSLLIRAKQKLVEFDICLACWAIPSGISAYLSRKPYFVWSLGSDINMYIHNPVSRFLLKTILKNAKTTFADSIGLGDKVKKLSGKKCHFMPTIRQLPASKIKTDVDQSRFNFAFVGRLEKVKGIDILISSMIGLQTENIMLYVLGDGSLRSSLEKEVKSAHLSDKIIFKGLADAGTIAGYIRDVDYLIIPSRNESIPMVFWEAMQMGTRVIGTDVGDLGYWIRKLDVGKVIWSNDKIGLMQAMLKCIRHKLPPFGKVKIPTAKDSAKIFLDIL